MKKLLIFIFAFTIFTFGINSCKHEIPLFLDDIDKNIDTSKYPCSPDTVYYQNQIQPIFNTYCTGTDCHSGPKPKENLNLSSYANAIASGKIKPYNAADSKVYKSLIDSDPGDRMPPGGSMPQEKIDLIKKWINQGAKNNYCDDSKNPCDSSNITYSLSVKKVMTDYCIGCHASSASVPLTTYVQVKNAVQNRNLWKSVNHFSGSLMMPPDASAKLSNCNLRKIKIWIDSGMPDN